MMNIISHLKDSDINIYNHYIIACACRSPAIEAFNTKVVIQRTVTVKFIVARTISRSSRLEPLSEKKIQRN